MLIFWVVARKKQSPKWINGYNLSWRPLNKMNTQGIDQLLGQLRAASARAAGTEPASSPAEGADFAALLKSSLDQANNAQQDANGLAKAFEQGDPNANLQEVMVSLQKANLSFQTMLQVRNKLVSAYHDVMNMQV
jgi:flagellar hook-basal body complex protein FliE